MNINTAACFAAEELTLADRLLAARAQRLGCDVSELLRGTLRDLAFAEAGRPDDLTESAVMAAEAKAAEALAAQSVVINEVAPE